MMRKFILIAIICALAVFFYTKKGVEDYAGDIGASMDFTSNANIEAIDSEEVFDLTFYDYEGEEVTLSQFRGKKIIVNLWASWCAPCLKELPELDDLKQRYQDDLEVIALNVEGDRESALAGFNDFRLEYLKFYYDEKQNANDIIGIMGLPTSIVLDENLRIKQKISGYLDWHSEQARNLLDIEG